MTTYGPWKKKPSEMTKAEYRLYTAQRRLEYRDTHPGIIDRDRRRMRARARALRKLANRYPGSYVRFHNEAFRRHHNPFGAQSRALTQLTKRYPNVWERLYTAELKKEGLKRLHRGGGNKGRSGVPLYISRAA